MDNNIGERIRIYSSYLFDGLLQPDTSDKNNLLTDGNAERCWRSQTGVVNAIYVWRPNLLASVVASVSRRWNVTNAPVGFPSWTSLGANVPNMVPNNKSSPYLTITKDCSATYNGSHSQPSTVGYLGTAWSWTRGKHTVDFGGETTRKKVVRVQDWRSDGYFTFAGSLTGDNAADFVLGRLSNCLLQQIVYQVPVGTLPACFVSDAWKVHRRLTVALGVRWNPWVMMYDRAYD